MKNQMTQDLYKVQCPINGELVRTFELACEYQKGVSKVLAAKGELELARMIKVTFWKTITF
jgi:hypothetical protein